MIADDTPDEVRLKVAPLFAPTSIDDVFGMLAVGGPPKTLEEMDEGVRTMARQRARVTRPER